MCNCQKSSCTNGNCSCYGKKKRCAASCGCTNCANSYGKKPSASAASKARSESSAMSQNVVSCKECSKGCRNKNCPCMRAEKECSHLCKCESCENAPGRARRQSEIKKKQQSTIESEIPKDVVSIYESEYTVEQLQNELSKLGLSKTGKKSDLARRLAAGNVRDAVGDDVLGLNDPKTLGFKQLDVLRCQEDAAQNINSSYKPRSDPTYGEVNAQRLGAAKRSVLSTLRNESSRRAIRDAFRHATNDADLQFHWNIMEQIVNDAVLSGNDMSYTYGYNNVGLGKDGEKEGIFLSKCRKRTAGGLAATLLHEALHSTVTRRSGGPEKLTEGEEHVAIATLGDLNENFST